MILRSSIVVTHGLLSFLLLLPAQQSVFRTGTNLLEIEVRVIDGGGHPVLGLSSADFLVTVNKKQRPTVVAEQVHAGRTPPTISNSLPSTEVVPNRDSPVGRTVVLVIDDLSVHLGQGRSLTVAAERTLDGLDLADRVGILSTSGSGPVVIPTRDRTAILTALRNKAYLGKHVATTSPFFVTVREAVLSDRGLGGGAATRECSNSPLGESCSSLVRAASRRIASEVRLRTQEQLDALESIVRALGQWPSPRVIVLMTAGLVVDGEQVAEKRLKRLLEAAAGATVQIYGIVEVTDGVELSDRGPGCMPPCINRAAARRLEGDFLYDGAQVVATSLGGTVFRSIGQADRLFDRIYAETSSFYRLGVDVGDLDMSRSPVDVGVRVLRPGATTRYARQVELNPTSPRQTTEEKLAARLEQGGASLGVPLEVRTATRQQSADRKHQLLIDVDLPRTVSRPVDLRFVLIDSRGRSVQAGKKLVEGLQSSDTWLTLAVELPEGDYRLRVAAADGERNVGSIDRRVQARLRQIGMLTSSDLLVSWIGADGQARATSATIVPADATQLRTTLELYPSPADAESDLVVRFAVKNESGALVIPLNEIVPTGSASSRIASLIVPLRQLASGTYTVTAAVLRQGIELGTLTADVEKR